MNYRMLVLALDQIVDQLQCYREGEHLVDRDDAIVEALVHLIEEIKQ